METGRQRLEGILAHRPNRRLSWTTLVDATTRSVMPQAVQQMGPLDFYRNIACDILQFGDYGLQPDCQVVSPARLVWGAQDEWHQEGGVTVRRITGRWGVLTATFSRGHPLKHPVTTLRELDMLRNIWRESRYEVVNDDRPERTFRQVEKAIGASGLYVPVTDPSPVQQQIESDMGLKAYYLEGLDVLPEARTHLSLDRNVPIPRSVQPPGKGRVVAKAYLGGLHHRYSRAP